VIEKIQPNKRKTKIFMRNKQLSIDYLTGIVDRAKTICNVAREMNLENIIMFEILFLIIDFQIRCRCRCCNLPFYYLFVIECSNENITTGYQ
jgi:hypothetical protein